MKINPRKEVTSFVAGSSCPAAASGLHWTQRSASLSPGPAPSPTVRVRMRIPAAPLPSPSLRAGRRREIGSRGVRERAHARAQSLRALARSTPTPSQSGAVSAWSSRVRGRTLSCGHGWSRESPPRRSGCLPLCLGLRVPCRGGGLGRERRRREVPSRWAAPGCTEGLGY